jgi:hypothetical protein
MTVGTKSVIGGGGGERESLRAFSTTSAILAAPIWTVTLARST